MTRILQLALLLFSLPAFAAPVCMYQDNLSGPATGGEGGGGTYVDVFGTGFGSTLGSVTGTVNGTAITNFIYLGADNTGNRQQVGFQVPSGATGTGSIVLNFPGGSCSNMVFTVRSGSIYYIGSGIDNAFTGTAFNCTNLKNGTAGDGLGGSGTYASPWTFTNVSSTQINGGSSNVAANGNARTPGLYYAYCMNAGDQLIFLNGASYPYADSGSLYATFPLHAGLNGTSTAPTVLMARPGATVTLGGPNVSFGIRDYSDVGFVVSGLTLNQQSGFGEPSSGPYVREVNNIISAPNGYGSGSVTGGGQEAQTNTGFFILGNRVTNSCGSDSGGVSNKQYHLIYVYGNQIEIGWNRLDSSPCFNGIQWNYYTDANFGFGNGSIHDNDISGVSGAGINLATIDTAQGAINVYNNIIHHVGLSPASDGDGGHSCITFPGEAPSATGTGTVNVYNNTFADCSYYANTSNSSYICAVSYSFQTAQPSFTVNFRNNIFYQPVYTYTSSYNVFFCPASSPEATLIGSGNIFYYGGTPSGTSPASSMTSLTVPTDPKFVSTTFSGPWTNLGLLAASPAIGAGVNTLYPTYDFEGTTYSNPPAIGALMYGGVVAPSGLFVSPGVYIGSGVSLH